MKALFGIVGLICVSFAHGNVVGKVVVSNIVGDSTSISVGTDHWKNLGAGWTPFGKMRFSSDGEHWALSGSEFTSSTAQGKVIVTGSSRPWRLTGPVVRQGDPSGYQNQTYSIDINLGSVLNNGSVYFDGFSGQATNGLDQVVRWNGSSQVICRMNEPVPGYPDKVIGMIDGLQVTEDGRIRFQQLQFYGYATHNVYYERQNAAAGQILLETFETVPSGQFVQPDQRITLTKIPETAAESGDLIYTNTLSGPEASNRVAVLNNLVLTQRSQLPPNSGLQSPIKFLDQAKISPHGSHWLVEGMEDSLRAFVMVDGKSRARAADPIVPSSSEYWYRYQTSWPFFAMAVNDYGELLVSGGTSNPVSSLDEVVCYSVYGRSQIALREGDMVDLNGNGLPDDNAFVAGFDDWMYLSPNAMGYIEIYMKNSAAGFLGSGFIELKLPLTGDVDQSDEVDAVDIDLVIAAFGNTGTNLPEDIDGSGEVASDDIDIVIANFGRAR